LGGLGADTMIGGAGNDIYGVENVNDVVIELEGEGRDLIRTRVSYTLSANVEDGILLDSTHINLTGNALDNVLTGNAGNNILDGAAGADSMMGGAGDDIYIVDNIGDVVVEQAGEGHDLVKTQVSYVLSSNVEDGTLLGNTHIDLTGNSLDNVLTGNAGNNSLLGGLGADTMIGGAGDDIYGVENVNDVVIELEGEGRDLIRTKVSYTLSANVEDGTMLDSADLTLTGNSLDNVLTGNAGNNTLLGGQGADTMIGGAGNDIYGVENVNDVVVELEGEGHDLIRTKVSYTLSANVEDGTMLDSADLTLTGNSLDNVLTGNAGNNTLIGGAGADTLIGGAGNDIYEVDNINDVVIEQANEGHDLVRTSISYVLSNNLEDANLLGNADLTLTGNSLDNVLTGNAGNNTLLGGLGADTMIGGAGNDIYGVENVNDVVVELEGEGRDLIRTKVSYTLSANVEDGTMLDSADLTLTGNSLDNVLTGNAGNNTLLGGQGADTMIGGAGDDIYGVENVNDVVVELQGEGHDLIRTKVSYTLSANVEDGILLDSTHINLTGNALDNVLTGNAGNNILDGGTGNDTLFGAEGDDTLVGGRGNTTMSGGTGADSFSFINSLGQDTSSSHNVITDFNALEGDKIDLSNFDIDPIALGVQHLTFIGSSEFTGAGQLRFVDHFLTTNVTGPNGADFQIELVGVNTLSANDVLV
ncbi:calcium-binding protein, partial [Pseudomonas koreensis]